MIYSVGRIGFFDQSDELGIFVQWDELGENLKNKIKKYIFLKFSKLSNDSPKKETSYC